MSNELQEITKRLESLEQTVARLESEAANRQPKWFDKKFWEVADVEGFEEVTRLGREFRRTGQLPGEPNDSP